LWFEQCRIYAGVPSSKYGIRFLELLERDENAFDHLYCVSFRLLDAQWLVKRASYMEFNVSFWRVQYIDRSLFVLRQWHSYLFGFVVPGGLEINKNSAGARTGSR
jgi:hypothetical protein